MATKSSIKWKESTFEQRFKMLFQFIGSNQIFSFNPFKHIFIFLRRIARCTSRNNVLDVRMPAFSNRNYMIKSCSGITTVSTFSVKFFQNLHLSFRRYWLTIAFSTVSMLSSFAAVFFAGRVSNSRILSFVRFAQTAFDYKVGFQPLPAFTTPTQTFLKHKPSFTNTNSVGFWFIITSSTFTFQIVKTRNVFGKKMHGLPFFANRAFFQACFNSFQIIDNGNLSLVRGAFYRSVFCLSHIVGCFSLYNSSIGEIIL